MDALVVVIRIRARANVNARGLPRVKAYTPERSRYPSLAFSLLLAFPLSPYPCSISQTICVPRVYDAREWQETVPIWKYEKARGGGQRERVMQQGRGR